MPEHVIIRGPFKFPQLKVLSADTYKPGENHRQYKLKGTTREARVIVLPRPA